MKIGLSLGGGGARGLAHIGVLKVLIEAGIPIDLLSGTSMGGIIAAAYAKGYDIGSLEERVLNLSKVREIMKLIDLTPARRGLLEGSRVRAYLANIIGEETCFADLQKPVSLVSVDLQHAVEVVLNEGSLLQAVMATISVVGLFTPVSIGEHLLVDGGILNNVPADVTRNMGADIVIAVDVLYNPTYDPPLNEIPQLPRLPFPVPEPFNDFYRAEFIMIAALTTHKLALARPEVLIRPAIPPDITMFLGFPQAAEIIAAGEEATRAALPDIERAIYQKSISLN